jgi:uncharacterized protein YqeY
MLRAKLFSDQTTAMKARDSARLEVIRFIVARIRNREIDEKRELDEAEVLQIVQKYARELDEAIQMATQAKRPDLIEQNEAQKVIAQEYLPAQLTDEELNEALDSIIAAHTQNDNPRAIIGIVMKELRGKADPGRIMQALKSKTG